MVKESWKIIFGFILFSSCVNLSHKVGQPIGIFLFFLFSKFFSLFAFFGKFRLWVLHFSHCLAHLRIEQNRHEISFTQYQNSFYVRYQNSYLYQTSKVLIFAFLFAILGVIVDLNPYDIDKSTCL